MRALPVQPEPLWRTHFRQRIAVSLWFVPAILAAASIAAADLTIWLDARVDAPIGVRRDLVSDPGGGLRSRYLPSLMAGSAALLARRRAVISGPGHDQGAGLVVDPCAGERHLG